MELKYELLEETKKAINKMVFFKDNIKIDENKYIIINDFDEACNNAFEEYFEYGENDEYTWDDILSENMSAVKKIIYKETNYSELTKAMREIEVVEEAEIEFTFDDEDVIEEIQVELDMCVQSRLVCGKNNSFFESLFEVYCLGGWPCGWNNGKIIVYVPENSI